MIILFYIFLALSAFHFLTRYSRRGRLTDKIPGELTYPIVGNLLKYNTTCPHELWKRVRTITSRYYPITRIWFIYFPVISIRHPDDVEVILTSQKAIDKGYVRDYLYPYLKTGLVTSTGKKWRQRRNLLTLAFDSNILKDYLDIMNKEGDNCIAELKIRGEEQAKDLVSFCSKSTLNVICESVMDVSVDTMKSEAIDKYERAIDDFRYTITYRISRPYIFDWMMKLPWKIGNTQRDAIKTSHEFTDKVVKARRKYHELNQNIYLKELQVSSSNDIDINDTEQKKRLTMLDVLLAAEKKGLIDGEGVNGEVDTFIFEGHDTTGMAMTYTLMLLAENQKAQDQARDEVTEVLNRIGEKIGMAELQEFPYLDRCIKESLRLFPPVATLLRHTVEDLQLKNALVPGNSQILLQVFDLHRDPNYWPEPEKFDPDRFLPEQMQNRHPFAYVPFSAGPRNCIGQKFAMMELKTTIARILYNFYLKPVTLSSDVKLTMDIVLRPFDPIYTKLVRISKK